MDMDYVKLRTELNKQFNSEKVNSEAIRMFLDVPEEVFYGFCMLIKKAEIDALQSIARLSKENFDQLPDVERFIFLAYGLYLVDIRKFLYVMMNCF